MNLSWQLGDTKITRIEELIGPLFDPVRFFPDFHKDLIKKHQDWLLPNHLDMTSGRIIASMHSWLVETPHHKILIDGCIGNDKDRNPYRDWHQMQTNWPAKLQYAGVSPAEIDYVLCTHLHVDHVGWNTQLIDGSWQPTFPRARYVFSKVELAQLEQSLQNLDDSDQFALVNKKTYYDSIAPILGQTDLVVESHDLISDRLSIQLTPGHTAGSITLSVASEGEGARFCGDICHHPLQAYEPWMNSAYCELPNEAIDARRTLLETCAEDNLLLMPAHFGPSHAAYVDRRGDSFSLRWC
jgi:glyoxylase-like metal-dependent hydrolase (beta-lactamase superfamily II)